MKNITTNTDCKTCRTHMPDLLLDETFLAAPEPLCSSMQATFSSGPQRAVANGDQQFAGRIGGIAFCVVIILLPQHPITSDSRYVAR